MLDNKSIKEFVTQLDDLIQSLITTAKANESWPQDSQPDVYAEIEALSNALHSYRVTDGDFSSLPKDQCIAAMSLLEYDRSLVFLKNYIQTDDIDLAKLLRVEPDSDPEAINYTIIMLNRLVLLARVNVLDKVFAKERVQSIRDAITQFKIEE
jgi:hypothetical protein